MSILNFFSQASGSTSGSSSVLDNLSNGAHWLARAYVGLDPSKTDGDENLWSLASEKMLVEMGNVALTHYPPTLNGQPVSVPATRYQGDLSVVHLMALGTMAKSAVKAAIPSSLLPQSPTVNLLQHMADVQHLRETEMQTNYPRTIHVRTASPRRRLDGQVQARPAGGLMRQQLGVGLTSPGATTSPSDEARRFSYDPPPQAVIDTGYSKGAISYRYTTPDAASASSPNQGGLSWESQVDTGILSKFSPFARCPSPDGGPFQMSCETQQALSGALKLAVCHFMKSVADDLCDASGNLNAGSPLLHPSDSGSGSAWGTLFGKLACSLLTAIPDALCPPEDSAPRPALPIDPDCNFAVEGS
jgi:hypothetical protein